MMRSDLELLRILKEEFAKCETVNFGGKIGYLMKDGDYCYGLCGFAARLESINDDEYVRLISILKADKPKRISDAVPQIFWFPITKTEQYDPKQLRLDFIDSLIEKYDN